MEIRNKWLKWLWSAAKWLLCMLLISVAVDWWRQPKQPVDFAQEPLPILAGDPLTLQQFSRDKAVVLYFWGSWCGICRHTSPVMESLSRRGYPVLGIAIASGTDGEVERYMRKNDLTFATVNDETGELSRRWAISVTPTVAIIKNGKMIHHTSGLSSESGLRFRVWLSDLID